MRFLSRTPQFDFMRYRRLWMFISAGLMLLALGSLLTRGLALGIDFTGGTLVEVSYPRAVELRAVREALKRAGFHDAVVQHFGTSRDVLVRLPPDPERSKADLSTHILRALEGTGEVRLRRVEFVGPQVGEELTEKGGLAMLGALAGILLYVMIRFEKRFALGAVLALVHDSLATVGFFSLTGMEFNLTVLAAVLAVIGYSLNDTIVLFDRIRENFRKMRKGSTLQVVNAAINQTLSRTLVTSFTTLLVLLSLVFLGGEAVRGFAVALIVGLVVGTYSSIYVASSLALALGVSRKDLMPVKKEGAPDAQL